MPKIIPIKELKNTSEISEMCHKSDEPVYVTKNGYGDMVIMSMETFEKSNFLNNLYDKLAIAEADLKAGRVSDIDVAISDIRKQYDL